MKLRTGLTVKSLPCTTLLGCLAITAAAITPARAQDVSSQLSKYGCVACHAVDTKLVGPSFKDVAAKYRGKPGAEKQLVAKIKNGGSGVWGSVPMPPNPTVPDADLTAMVRSILSQK
jgi:cytochrome c